MNTLTICLLFFSATQANLVEFYSSVQQLTNYQQMLVAVPAFHRTVVNETWENIVVGINSVLAFYLNEALIFFMSSWILENFLSLSNFQEIAECETIPETTTVQTTDVSTTTVTTTTIG